MVFDSSLNPAMVGSAVYTSDGDRIGRVKELRGAYFRVGTVSQDTYWLRRDAVSMATRRGVMLKLDSAHLDKSMLDPPNGSPSGQTPTDRPALDEST